MSPLCNARACPGCGSVRANQHQDLGREEPTKPAVYSKNLQKQVTAWYGIRTSAAHAKYAEYDTKEVENMIAGVRNFLAGYPA